MVRTGLQAGRQADCRHRIEELLAANDLLKERLRSRDQRLASTGARKDLHGTVDETSLVHADCAAEEEERNEPMKEEDFAETVADTEIPVEREVMDAVTNPPKDSNARPRSEDAQNEISENQDEKRRRLRAVLSGKRMICRIN